MSKITRPTHLLSFCSCETHPLYWCSAAVTHLTTDGNRLFRRLEEVLVIGMRMTEGISHKVKPSCLILTESDGNIQESEIKKRNQSFWFF